MLKTHSTQHINDKILSLLVNRVKDYAIFVLDPQGNIISWNTGAQNIKGYTEKEIIGKNMSVFYTQVDNDEKIPQHNLNEALKRGAYESEGWRLRKDGSIFWANVVFTTLYDDEQKLLGFAKITRDITEQKKADTNKVKINKNLEARIREEVEKKIQTELRYRKLIENSHDGISLLDRDFNLIYRSASAERINGWNNEEREKLELSGLFHPDDQELVRDLFRQVLLQPGRPISSTYRAKHKLGHYIWVEALYTNMLDDEHIHAIVCNFRDITERKLAQEQIIENERFIKTITDHLPALLVYWTADFRCLFANKTALAYFGKSEEEMIGIARSELMNVDNQGPNDRSAYLNRVLQGQTLGFENEVTDAAGKKSFYKVHLIPDWDGDQVKGYFSLAFDITELKHAEAAIQRKTGQMADLLENMTDGFISLDENLCYIYANTRIGEMLGTDAKDLIGKNVWELFPEAVGTEVYHAMNAALQEKKHLSLIEYNTVLNLWLENSIYPAGGGISMFIRDITKDKQEEQHLKLLESVTTTTTDSVVITEALPLNEPGPRIIYVNEAFTKMTGYLSEEVIGKSPRMFQGPKTDKNELKLLSKALREGCAHEVTTINYKKSGEEFWINLAVSPVMDDNGLCTHFIAVERDITERKNEELKKSLLAEISLVFNEPISLIEMLQQVLERLVEFGNFSIAETWLLSTDKTKLNLAARFAKDDKVRVFYEGKAGTRSFGKGSGLPGVTWETRTMQFWNDIDRNDLFLRKDAAKKAGLKAAYGLPLIHNDEVLGVLVFGLRTNERQDNIINKLFENLTEHFAAEIRRKQLEVELKQLFNHAPDIIFIMGTDGYYKKVNPAMSAITEYTEEELLGKHALEFVHPDDRERSVNYLREMIGTGQPTCYLENRFITKSGKIKWLAWTITPSIEEELVFGVAKDITDKKELESLLNKVNDLARIGGWEVDLVKDTVYWSDITREIHEVAADYRPDIKAGINFYKSGEDRDVMVKLMEDAALNGRSGAAELRIVTAKGNIKWVRVIVEAEFNDNKCSRIYGSFQDIDARKKAEIAGKMALEERNTILESIDDAFFAVDRNWIVTYWNNMAEKVLMVTKEQTLDHHLWEIFADSIDSKSYQEYHKAMETNQATRFEDYYTVLEKWYEISAYPSNTGLSVYFKDITDRKQSEMQLKELNDSLKKHAKELAISNAELEQFAYVASHDLQEPLRMVTSFLTQLDKKYNDVIDIKGRQYIYFAVDGAKRMRQIILDLLEFSRVGRTDDDLEEVNFDKLVKEVIALYRRQMEELGAKILFEDLPTIQTYKTPLRQVFQNLIGNSLKYHRNDEAPLIEISCKETKTYFQFAVKDNGIGIAEEYFDKIFIIFQRLHNKDEYAGTGMGLALAKKIIENLGGKIWLKSAEGKGTTFYFTILKN